MVPNLRPTASTYFNKFLGHLKAMISDAELDEPLKSVQAEEELRGVRQVNKRSSCGVRAVLG